MDTTGLDAAAIKSLIEDANNALAEQKRKSDELEQEVKRLTEESKKPKSRLTVTELEEQLQGKIDDVQKVLTAQYEAKINQLRGEVTKQTVLKDFADLPDDYQNRVTGLTEEEIREAAQREKDNYTKNLKASQRQTLIALGLDPDSDIESLKSKLSIKEEAHAEVVEEEKDDLEATLEKLKGTDAEVLIRQALKAQQVGKLPNAPQGGSITVETPPNQGVPSEASKPRTLFARRI